MLTRLDSPSPPDRPLQSEPMSTGTAASSRSKRDVILRTAAEEFGRNGFDATKWADIALPAGIGSTALYHYFESKAHCLFTLMLESWQVWYERWSQQLASLDDPEAAILGAVATAFALTEHEAIQNRLLANEQGKLSTYRSTGREQAVRNEALKCARRVEKLWVEYLDRAMAAGALPRQDPRLLAHAIIGLLQSVWMWYRPGGRYSLSDLSAYYQQAVRALILAV
jgi:TetR/AcrR family transcriptional regulator, cholesterol catabolism regulator